MPWFHVGNVLALDLPVDSPASFMKPNSQSTQSWTPLLRTIPSTQYKAEVMIQSILLKGDAMVPRRYKYCTDAQKTRPTPVSPQQHGQNQRYVCQTKIGTQVLVLALARNVIPKLPYEDFDRWRRDQSNVGNEI